MRGPSLSRWIKSLVERVIFGPKPGGSFGPAEPGMVHVFTGSFGSAKAARAYCLEPSAPHPKDAPTQLNQDLPEAFVDPAGLYIAYGPSALDELLRLLPVPEAERLHELPSVDTWIVLTPAAFGGLPFRLQNTPRLTYLGARPAKDT